MRTVLPLIAVAVMACSDVSEAGPLDFSNPNQEATAAAQAALETTLAEAVAVGSPISITAIYFDLDGDGKPEIVGQLHSAFFCGGRGPCFFAIKDDDAENLSVVLNLPGVDTAEVLEETNNGWKDLRFNGETVWQWNGETYEIK